VRPSQPEHVASSILNDIFSSVCSRLPCQSRTARCQDTRFLAAVWDERRKAAKDGPCRQRQKLCWLMCVPDDELVALYSPVGMVSEV